jgi:DNA-binding response OmpR family regulator
MKVVLLDDSFVVCAATKDALEELGFRVVVLDNPFLLGSVVRREHPDVVLLDVMMPLVSGDHVAKIVRQNDQVAQVPFVLYSDAPAETLATMARECGAVGFIPKSVTEEELAQRIRHFAGAVPLR